MDYAEISKETIGFLHKSYASLKNSPLNQSIRVLVELRVSQMNGCAYCCNIHSKEARSLGIEQDKLDLMPAWHNSDAFNDQERAALYWAEAVTILDPNLNDFEEDLLHYFSEREIVDLTATVSIMNALNRARNRSRRIIKLVLFF